MPHLVDAHQNGDIIGLKSDHILSNAGVQVCNAVTGDTTSIGGVGVTLSGMSNIDQLKENINSLLKEGVCVLIKASRKYKFEEIFEVVK